MSRKSSHSISDRVHFPYEAPWPQRLEGTKLIAAVVAILVAAVFIYFAVEGVRRNEPDTAIGFSGFALLLSTSAAIALGQGGLRHLTVPNRVSRDQNRDHGMGILVPHKRDLLLTLLLGSIPVAALPALLPHDQDQSELSLLDEVFLRIGGPVGATVLGTLSLAIFILSLVIRTPTSLGIYPNGLHLVVCRHIPFFTSTTEKVIEWDHIESITPTLYSGPNSNSPTRHPVIRIDGVVVDPRTGDKVSGLEVPVYRLTGEPNTIYRLLRFFHENPDERSILSDCGSIEFLRSPSLRERLLAARTQRGKA